MGYSEDFWLFKKHKDYILKTNYSAKQLWQKLESKNIYPFNYNKDVDTLFDWKKIQDTHFFFFDYIGCEQEIAQLLFKSKLVDHDVVLVDTDSSEPIIEVPVNHFIKNWYDFALSSGGMGSFIITSDYKLLIEFTNDARYMLYSNFKIK